MNEPRTPSAADLRANVRPDESSLVRIILDELMTEDQARALAASGVDCFDLIAGNYSGAAAAVVEAVFADWNRRANTSFFVTRANLLAG